MRRREFIRFLGGAALTLPLDAAAQTPYLPVVGFLHQARPYPALISAFAGGLNDAGYIEGKNVSITEGQYDRLPAMASDLVQRRVALIAT